MSLRPGCLKWFERLRLATQLQTNFHRFAIGALRQQILLLRVGKNPLERLGLPQAAEQPGVFLVFRQQPLETGSFRGHKRYHARAVGFARANADRRLALRAVDGLVRVAVRQGDFAGAPGFGAGDRGKMLGELERSHSLDIYLVNDDAEVLARNGGLQAVADLFPKSSDV